MHRLACPFFVALNFIIYKAQKIAAQIPVPIFFSKQRKAPRSRSRPIPRRWFPRMKSAPPQAFPAVPPKRMHKRQLDEMCDEMGMNLTTFFMIYAKKALRDRRIPFEVTPLWPLLLRFQHGAATESEPAGEKRADNRKNNGRTGGYGK